jgi:hypothetical protein
MPTRKNCLSAFQGQILALACAELSALSANHSEKAHHSLMTLFAELDAFKIRFSTLSTLAQPHYQVNQQSVFTDNSNREPPLALFDHTIDAANSNQSAALEPFCVDDSRSADQTAVVSAPNHGPADCNAAYGLTDIGAMPLQADVDNQVIMNEYTFQTPHDSHALQGRCNRDVAPSTEDAVAGASSSNSANIDIFFDDFVNFDPAASEQGHEGFRMTAALEQDIDVQPTVPDVSRSASSALVTPADGNNPRYRCPGCTKSFSRRGDRDRHARSHDSNARRFPCPAPHCSREFTRKDKLLDHQRRLRH